MESKQYLPVGLQLGGHYEIIEVLGEDDFEILYLVKDTHRLQTMFVIKELFLKNISLRTQDYTIHTLEHSKYIFEETKKELILEAQKLQTSHYQKDKIQTYGYFEENNTIYIIMEFINDIGLNSYLNVQPIKENKIIPPSVKEEYELKQEKPKSTFFLKVLIGAVLVFVGLGIYAYKMIEENKEKAKEKPSIVVKNTPMQHPELTNRIQDKQKNDNSTPLHQKEETEKNIPLDAEYITENKDKEKTNSSHELFNNVPKDEIYIDNEIEEIENKEPEFQAPYVAPPPIPAPSTPSVSLGTKINTPQNNEEIVSTSLGTPIKTPPKKVNLKTFTRASVENFLHTFIASSATGSVDSITSHYDYHVDRYFSLRNITQSKIKEDKIRYNRKWTHRNFQIVNFYITRKYQKDGTEYCDVKTKTKWSVSTNSGKHRSGTSRGLMTIKNTDHGFKVKSIYTLK